jgi:hypothetical protein
LQLSNFCFTFLPSSSKIRLFLLRFFYYHFTIGLVCIISWTQQKHRLQNNLIIYKHQVTKTTNQTNTAIPKTFTKFHFNRKTYTRWESKNLRRYQWKYLQVRITICVRNWFLSVLIIIAIKGWNFLKHSAGCYSKVRLPPPQGTYNICLLSWTKATVSKSCSWHTFKFLATIQPLWNQERRLHGQILTCHQPVWEI